MFATPPYNVPTPNRVHANAELCRKLGRVLRRYAHRASSVADEDDGGRQAGAGRHGFRPRARRGTHRFQRHPLFREGGVTRAEDIELADVDRRHERKERAHETVADRGEALELEVIESGEHRIAIGRRLLHEVGVTAESDDADAHPARLLLHELDGGGTRRLQAGRRDVTAPPCSVHIHEKNDRALRRKAPSSREPAGRRRGAGRQCP